MGGTARWWLWSGLWMPSSAHGGGSGPWNWAALPVRAAPTPSPPGREAGSFSQENQTFSLLVPWDW